MSRFLRPLAPLLALAVLGPVTVAAQEASSPVPASGMTEETRFAITIAPDTLPPGDVEAIWYRLTLDPGSTLPNLAGPLCGCPNEELAPGVGVETVLTGAYGLRFNAPIEVQRAGGQPEAVAAGTEITLGPGDTAVYPEYAASGEIWNAGTDPLVLLGFVVVSTVGSGTPAPTLPPGVKGEALSTAYGGDWTRLGGGPVTVTLQQLVLPPRAGLPPYEVRGLEALHVEAGEIEVNVVQPGQATPAGRPLTYRAGRTMTFIGLRPGSQRLVHNAGDGAAVIWTLRLTPVAAAGTPTP